MTDKNGSKSGILQDFLFHFPGLRNVKERSNKNAVPMAAF